MKNKYCKKEHPCIAKDKSGSMIWKKMVSIREEVEHKIWLQLKASNSNFWFDNWIKQGAV